MPGFLVIFLLIVLALLALSVYFLRYLAEGRRLRAARIALVFFELGSVGGLFFLFSTHRTDGWAGLVTLPIILLLVAQMIVLALVAVVVSVRFFLRTLENAPYDEGRRRVLKNAALYPAAGVLLSSYGAFIERKHTVRRDYTIPVPNLPPEADGMVIAQISDVHLGMFFSVEVFDALLTEAAAGGADLLAVTGDVFDDERLNERAAKVLAAHTGDFRDGIWYCIGNHEYYHDGRPIVDRMAGEGAVHVVLNSAARVAGRGALYIAGVDYPFARGDGFYTQKEAYFTAAMADVSRDAVTVLLAHHPEFIDDAAAHGGVPLTLTGHTHGSQFGILGLPLFPVFKYTRGMVRIGDSYGYVHTGNGSWFPLRIGCPPEIAYFRLERTVQ
nr:metallophosphoesterase [uncultured Selenomonas sp.]